MGLGLLCLPLTFYAQSFTDVKDRFDHYLNLGSLEKYVDITPKKITLYKFLNGKKEEELVLPAEKWSQAAKAISAMKADSAGKLYELLLSQKEISTINASTPAKTKSREKPLNGLKICIDPGHIAGNMQMARTEQKYLHFTKEVYTDLKTDSVDIGEGMLTFQTASILQKMLEEKGAEVVLTRKNNCTTFGIPYDEWYKKHKKNTVDSLFRLEKITAQKHKQLLHMSRETFFVEFFKDFELQQRARVINYAAPDFTVIIHYNVNEKNAPWLKPSDKDYCMAFIPGCITTDNIQSPAGKINLLRLLLCNDINESEKISALLVNELSLQLNIPIAKTSDASYLSEHCIASPSAGVYCRNLALCRLVKSPLVYGECLYQDSNKECYELMKNTENVDGIKTNKRVVAAARAFYNAIIKYYN